MEKRLYDSAVDGIVEILDYELKHGADINSTTIGGLNLLMTNLIFGNNNKEYITYLLDNGINVNHTCATEQTALHIATMRANLEMVKLLLEAGVDINNVDYDNFNALLTSCKGWFMSFPFDFNSIKVRLSEFERNQLLSIGNSQWKFNRKELINNQYEIIKLLLESGVNTAQISKDGLNAMDLLIRNPYIEDLKYIDLLKQYNIESMKKYDKDYLKDFVWTKRERNIMTKKLKRIEK